jgi:transposase InsO family protein
MHAHARTTPRSRADIVRLVLKEGQTVRKWIERYCTEGACGLKERSSRSAHSPKRILPDQREHALQWRHQGLVYAEITQRTGLSEATLSRLLRTVSRQPGPPLPPVVRYKRATPGELLHLEIKKLGRIERVGHRISGDRREHTRGVGWECGHVCVDDHSRVAFAEVRPDEGKATAVASYACLGVSVQRVMTDNGSCYRSIAFRTACQKLGLRHVRTRPYTHSDERTAQLQRRLHRYNWHRPRRLLHRLPPISRPNLGDNVLTTPPRRSIHPRSICPRGNVASNAGGIPTTTTGLTGRSPSRTRPSFDMIRAHR